ncbi:hypothetical protein BV378_09090 [Nostoc sp. RF31YmG]|jgi:uncharacterized protein YjbI with pentapeptide repeats|nr:hypothetical protein BV378_09090 [Nostoc sp. RF31YmG]
MSSELPQMPSGDADEFLNRYADGERNFRSINLCRVVLEGRDLRGADLSEANLSGAKLYGADLRGVTMSYTNIENASLRGADLSGALLHRANLKSSSLEGVKFQGATLNLSNLHSAKLMGADFKGALISKTDFNQAFLMASDFKGAIIWETNFRQARLFGADFRAYSLTDVDLSNADLRMADLSLIKLDKVILKDARLDGAKIPDSVVFSTEGLIQHRESVNGSASLNEPVNNQGIPFNQNWRIYTWEKLRFRSKAEIKIAESLDQVGVLFLPNCLVRLNDPAQPSGRGNKEADFLVCYQGKWGMLEVDGPYHKPERRVEEQERERLFRHHGIRVIERFDASRCEKQPQEVVREFLKILKKMNQL